jgi:hypothetical protein
MHVLAQKVGGSIVRSHSQPGTRKGGWSTPRILRLTPGKDPVLVGQEAAWDSGSVWRTRENSGSPGFDPRTVRPVESRCTDWAIHGRHVSNIVKNHVIHSSVSSVLAACYIAYRRFCITHTVIFDRVSSVGAFLCRQVFHSWECLRKIFGPKRDEVTGDGRGDYDLYSSPNIIRVFK